MSVFRLLADDGGHAAPFGTPCPECGKPVGSSGGCSAAYLSGGALLLREDGHHGHSSDQLRAYSSVGVVDESGLAERTDVAVVEHLQGGQFHLQWCSVMCMRVWLLRLIAEVERRLAQAQAVELGAVPDPSGM